METETNRSQQSAVRLRQLQLWQKTLPKSQPRRQQEQQEQQEEAAHGPLPSSSPSSSSSSSAEPARYLEALLRPAVAQPQPQHSAVGCRCGRPLPPARVPCSRTQRPAHEPEEEEEEGWGERGGGGGGRWKKGRSREQGRARLVRMVQRLAGDARFQAHVAPHKTMHCQWPVHSWRGAVEVRGVGGWELAEYAGDHARRWVEAALKGASRRTPVRLAPDVAAMCQPE